SVRVVRSSSSCLPGRQKRLADLYSTAPPRLSGAIAYAVSQRTREIGVRMAIGAQPRDVLRLVLRQGAVLTLYGLGIGILASLVLTRSLASLLSGASATDPASFVGGVTLVNGGGLASLLLPCAPGGES